MTIEYANNTLVNFLIGYRAMRYNGYNDQMKSFHGSKARLDVWREGFALYRDQPCERGSQRLRRFRTSSDANCLMSSYARQSFHRRVYFSLQLGQICRGRFQLGEQAENDALSAGSGFPVLANDLYATRG